ncbi:MAG TPA: hypothetical protein VIE13_11180 [Terriglobales bacterium]
MNPTVEVLLKRAIDYAGLFPPAHLGMAEAVDNYRRYMAGEDRWALGRFVCPVERLPEFEAQLRDDDGKQEPWKLAAVSRGAPEEDHQAIAVFNLRAVGKARVDTVEARVASPAEARARLRAHAGLMNYCEVDPAVAGWEAVLDAVREGEARAKLRTGGVVAAAIPPPARVIAFLAACHARGLGLKATAGLHHAFTGRYALTYEPGSAQATMYGFVNLTLAAACLEMGGGVQAADQILHAANPADFAAVSLEQMMAGRRFFVGFGSCSFEEPLQWLHQLA